MEKKFKRRQKNHFLFNVFNTMFFAVLVWAVILPVLKILRQSLGNYNISDFYNGFDLQGDWDILLYKWIFKYSHFYRSIFVSAYTTLMVTFIGLFVTSVSAYILIQRDMPGRKIFAALLFIALVFDAGMIPRFLVMKQIGLLNSLWSVILPLSVNVVNIFIMRSYFESLPESIIRAAELDGCTPVQTFLLIVLPMSRAALAAIGFFFAAAAWNEYMSYIMYISDLTKYNMQWKLRDLFADKQYADNGISVNLRSLQCAYIILAMLPTVIILPFVSKYFAPVLEKAAVKE